MRIARAQVGGASRYGEIEAGLFHPLDGDVLARRGSRSGEPHRCDELRLASPTAPSKILITMGGFLTPGAPPPPDLTPWLLPKLASVVSGDHGVIAVPSHLKERIWIEAELAIVIGREVRSASEDEAAAAILGFTCFNDVSAPEFLFADVRSPKLSPTSDIFRAKSIDTFASMGPWIETELTEDDVRLGLEISTRINGETRAMGNTRNQKFKVNDWVRAASAYVTLFPGDVIALGTPQPCEAQPGDAVEIEIERIGVLHNRVVAAP